MSRPLLEGTFTEPYSPANEIAELKQMVAAAKGEAKHYKEQSEEAASAIRNLRDQLRPMYHALAQMFGEFNRVPDSPAGITNDKMAANIDVWNARIAKSSKPEARILQVLLDGGGEMTLTQIRTAARTYNETSVYLSRLKSKNWVEQLGRGLYNLKKL